MGGATLVTLYGGTDYTLAATAISLSYYSMVKAPFGFPLSSIKWTVEVTDVIQQSQATPTNSTWYNLGSIAISIPIGIWEVRYSVTIQEYNATPASRTEKVTLSTANNSESDSQLSIRVYASSIAGIGGEASKEKVLTLVSKTSYYLNIMTTSGGAGTTIYFVNDVVPAVIRALCVYL